LWDFQDFGGKWVKMSINFKRIHNFKIVKISLVKFHKFFENFHEILEFSDFCGKYVKKIKFDEIFQILEIFSWICEISKKKSIISWNMRNCKDFGGK
jgi:hypothetical protein